MSNNGKDVNEPAERKATTIENWKPIQASNKASSEQAHESDKCINA